MNLYCVYDRQQTMAFIVAADAGSKGALGVIADAMPALGWDSANTYTRRLIGNISEEPGVLLAVPLTHEAKVHVPSRHATRGRRKQLERRLASTA